MEKIVRVCRNASTLSDVHKLETKLELGLRKSRALEVGLCNKRRVLYDQLFDELIREITIECGERGILLFRVRENFRRMFNDFSNIYLSGNAYGLRTLLINEREKKEKIERIESLKIQIDSLKKQLEQNQNRLERFREIVQEEKSRIDKGFVPIELEQLRTTNSILKLDLDEALTKKLRTQ